MSDTFETANIDLSAGYIYQMPTETAPPGAWFDVKGFMPRDGYAEEVRQPHIISTLTLYSTGTVTVTNGSATVTGSGTTFTKYMLYGKFVSADGATYTITGWSNATTITLGSAYAGSTLAGQTYTIRYLGSGSANYSTNLNPAKVFYHEGSTLGGNLYMATEYMVFSSTNGGKTFDDINAFTDASGTVSVTNGSGTVTGTSSAFAAFHNGGRFTVTDAANGGPLGALYEITAVNVGAQTLIITPVYAGATNGAASYSVSVPLGRAISSTAVPRISFCSFRESAAGSAYIAHCTDYNGYLWNLTNGTRISGFDSNFTWLIASQRGFMFACGVGTAALAGGVPNNPMKIMWSDLGDRDTWTGGLSGFVVLNQGGNAIYAAKPLGDDLIIYTDAGMYRGQYVGQPYIWIFTKINNIGIWDYDTVWAGTNFHVFIGRSGFYVFDGSQAVPIGQEIWDYFYSKVVNNEGNRFPAGIVYDEGKNMVWVYFEGTVDLYSDIIHINLKTNAIGLSTFKTPINSNIIFYTDESEGYGKHLLTARSTDYVVLVDPEEYYSVPYADAQQSYIQTNSTSGMANRRGELLPAPDYVKQLGRCQVSGNVKNHTTGLVELDLTPIGGDTPLLSGAAITTQALTVAATAAGGIDAFSGRADFNSSFKYFAYKIATDNTSSSYNATAKVKIASIQPYLKLRGKI